MANIKSEKETTTTIDEDGREHTSIIEKTTKVERSGEPDYVKLYTKVWCEFNQIPNQWRPLFLELISRMSYSDSTDLDHSQIVATGGPIRDSICKTFGWKSNMYQKGLKALREAGAIRQMSRGFYQINPNYAGRGEWKYNPHLQRGGVEDLKATFDFKNGTVKVNIVWADDGEGNEINTMFRKALDTRAEDETVLKELEKSE